MKSGRRRIGPRLLVGLAAVVFVSGLLLAFGDAGLPLPVGLAVGALSICLAVVLAAAVGGYRVARAEGSGFWRSVGSGGRAAVSTFFFLF